MRTIALILVCLAFVFAILAATGLGPDLATIRSWLAVASGWKAEHPAQAMMLFFGAYVLVTAFSIPVALWMTLAAGALFGLVPGIIIVSFASTLGATVAFLTARFALRDGIRARFGGRLAALEEGFARDGWRYLVTLRLIPAVPFFVVNLLMGLTAIPMWQFAVASQAAMLPLTAIYVNAGTALAALSSPRDVLSPGLVAALLLVAAAPHAVRAVTSLRARARAYARWSRPARFDRDLIVIGGGAAGLVAANAGAAAAARVTLVEGGEMGGDCLNTGCVPSKALIRAARASHEVRTAGRFGIETTMPTIDWPVLFSRIHAAIAAIAPHDSAERYRALGVEVIAGHATIADPWTVEIAQHANDGGNDGRLRLTARSIVVATGSAPLVPAITGLDAAGYLTPETMWHALGKRDRAPRSLAVVGGGAAGCELSQAFARLGILVTLIEVAARILPQEDEDVSALVRAALERDGVRVMTGATLLSVTRSGDERRLAARHGAGDETVVAEEIIVLAGRAARLHGLGLEPLGLAGGRFITTDRWLRTALPNILAAGDVTGPGGLTNRAGQEGWIAAMNGLLAPFWSFHVDGATLPSTIYTDPEIARVGIGETEARRRGIAHDVTRIAMADLDRAIIAGATEGFVRILTAPGSDRVLGAVVAGENAGEVMAEIALAMRNGLGLRAILKTVHSYPTMAEANRTAAGVWQRARLDPRLIALVSKVLRWRRGAP